MPDGKKRIADIPWHSVAGLRCSLPRIFAKEQLDLLHVPYFAIPIFYTGAFVVTMHDLDDFSIIRPAKRPRCRGFRPGKKCWHTGIILEIGLLSCGT